MDMLRLDLLLIFATPCLIATLRLADLPTPFSQFLQPATMMPITNN